MRAFMAGGGLRSLARIARHMWRSKQASVVFGLTLKRPASELIHTYACVVCVSRLSIKDKICCNALVDGGVISLCSFLMTLAYNMRAKNKMKSPCSDLGRGVG